MCEYVSGCHAGNAYWVATRRVIPFPGDPEKGTESVAGKINVMTCSRHLPMAVSRLGAQNYAVSRDADDLDGVVVKVILDGQWV